MFFMGWLHSYWKIWYKLLLLYIMSEYILEREEVVESDHAAIGADVEWKVKRKRKARRK